MLGEIITYSTSNLKDTEMRKHVSPPQGSTNHGPLARNQNSLDAPSNKYGMQGD